MAEMKLSEAIRQGTKRFPEQAYNTFFNADKTAACALGCAIYSLYGEPKIHHELQLYEDFPVLDADFDGQSLIALISDWNDSQGMTREQIADKLESLGL